jgi:hypothetical protein
MFCSRMQAMWFLTEASFLVTLSLVCAVAFAQSTGDAVRGSTPPGMSQDGAKPADGAIKGGSTGTGGSAIAPGETGGLPSKKDPVASETRLQRCKEMTGSLREECLKKERGGAVGGTSAPDAATDILKKP